VLPIPRTQPTLRSRTKVAAVAAVAVIAGATGCTGSRDATSQTYDLPGETVFPEGIGVDKSTGDFFVGSTSDGTIYRGNVDRDDVDVFLPGGEDGRTAATGVKVDNQGRLWVAGRDTGRAFVYDVATGDVVRRSRRQRPTVR